jgi:ABC-2 type transport system permease protein
MEAKMNGSTKVNSALHPIANHWARGFKSIYQRELGAFFRVRSWTIQLAIWLVLLVVLPAWAASRFRSFVGDPEPGRGVTEYFLAGTGSLMIYIGVILLAQGAIVDEKSTKTLSWVFSKPLSSTGFILGKFAACAMFIAIVIIGCPGVVALIAAKLIGLSSLSTISSLRYLAALGVLFLTALFFLALSIVMGTIFKRSRAVAGFSLFALFAGILMPLNEQLRKLEAYTVWGLSGVPNNIFLGQQIQSATWIAMIFTAIMTAVFLAIAIWRIGKYEQQ